MGQGVKVLFSKDFIIAFTILSISAMPFLSVPFEILLLFYISLYKVHITFAILSNLCNSLAFHLNPRPRPFTIRVNCGQNSKIPSVRLFNNRFSRARAGPESLNPRILWDH